MLDYRTNPGNSPGQSPSARSRYKRRWSDEHTSQSNTPKNKSGVMQGFAYLTALMAFVFLQLASFTPAQASDKNRVLDPGDLVVTGFSGIRPVDGPVAEEANPLDSFFIDTDGPAAQIKSLRSVQGAPNGQIIDAPVKHQVKASEVGQVFAVAIDDGMGRDTPYIYLGATSYYGIQIVRRAPNDGRAERLRTGEPDAEFMDGQFGPKGGPGSIWRVDGRTGKVKLFATLPDNSGAGIGDIVYDKETQTFYVSDLDNGLIYRLNKNGKVIDSFDHGVDGRPAKGLSAVADNGELMDISSPSFDIEKPSTWGYTQKARRVGGLALRNGRLFYAVHGKHQVWSIGLEEDGSFSQDVQWEFDAKNLPGKGPITDMLFDGTGRIYLAQRGKAKGAYNYAEFAEPGESSVTRYRRESPDNPETESTWVEDNEEYAIGIPGKHTQANGGIALGYAHDDKGAMLSNACGAMLWSTGSRLQRSAYEDGEDNTPKYDVHGLQGNAITLVRPENEPPQRSYFSDYDSFFGDRKKAGHMGDVEIWQPCGVKFAEYDEPGYIVPEPEIPPFFPPEWIPPEDPFSANLRLTKWAHKKKCFFFAGKWRCRFKIRVRNTGPDAYFGPILVKDRLPTPLGSTLTFAPPPGWSCWTVGVANYRCGRPLAFLAPGQSVVITAFAKVPANYPHCHLRNVAEILWAPGGTQWNTNPFDDIDSATVIIPKPDCPDGKKTNLRIRKSAAPQTCIKVGANYRCRYRIRVRNTGPGVYNGIIRVKDTPPAGTTLIGSAPAIWSCNLGTGSCQHPATTLNPGQAKTLWVWVNVPINVAKAKNCKIRNKARITFAPSPTSKNTNPADDMDTAIANIPQHVCQEPKKSNLRLRKTALSNPCLRIGSNFYCRYRVRVRNTGPDTYIGSIKVRDNYLPGTTATFGASPAWNCSALVPPAHDCTYPFAIIPPGGYRDLLVTNKVPMHRAKAYNCKIRNRARILVAPGGSNKNTNPGDDADDAIANIYSGYCKKTNLRIKKTASPSLCTVGGQGNTYFCKYKVEVRNTGPGVFHGQIKVKDIPTPGALVNIQSGAWNCAGLNCTYPTTTLHPGQKRSFNITLAVSKNLAKQRNCKIPNRAKITSPLGSPRNVFAWDDQSLAIANVPLHVCQDIITPPPAPDCPPGFTWNPLTGSCMPVLIPPAKTCPPGFKPIRARQVRSLRAKGWTVKRYGRRWCGKPGKKPPVVGKPECPAGLQKVAPKRVKALRRRGWKIIRTNRGLWCGKPGSKPPVAAPKCPKGMKPISAARVRVLRNRGWVVKRIGRNKWCGRPGKPVVRPKCPRGMKPIAASRVRALRRQGWVTRQLSNGRWCGRPGRVKPVRKCPRGTIGKWPNCKKIIIRRCPKGTVGRWPNCRRVNTGPVKIQRLKRQQLRVIQPRLRTTPRVLRRSTTPKLN